MVTPSAVADTWVVPTDAAPISPSWLTCTMLRSSEAKVTSGSLASSGSTMGFSCWVVPTTIWASYSPGSMLSTSMWRKGHSGSRMAPAGRAAPAVRAASSSAAASRFANRFMLYLKER